MTFDIDANGIVSVSARIKELEKNEGEFKPLGLSEDEIKNMVKDAEANKEADKKKKRSRRKKSSG